MESSGRGRIVSGGARDMDADRVETRDPTAGRADGVARLARAWGERAIRGRARRIPRRLRPWIGRREMICLGDGVEACPPACPPFRMHTKSSKERRWIKHVGE